MNEHDARILAPKLKTVHDREILQAFAESHWFCQSCGRSGVALQIHHIIGGRGGRSDELCNLLRVCWHPCHDLFGGADILSKDWLKRGEGHDPYLPKLTIMHAIAMKERAGELTGEGLARLALLHGRTLPDFEPIPVLFVEQHRANRPELYLSRSE